MNAWQWFLAHGDKLLGGITGALLALVASGTIPPNTAWVAAVTGVLGVLHTVFFPEPKASGQGGNVGGTGSGTTAAKQGGFARVGLLAAVAALAIAACSSLGLATPKGFDQSLAEAYGVHTAIASATATALTTGAITAAEATVVQNQVQSSRAMLDAAKAAESAGNTSGAAQDLALATTALTALQTYLNSRGAAVGK